MRDPDAARDTLRVLVVDDESLARERLARLLGRIEGVTLAGEAESSRTALAQMVAVAPDVVLLDVEMPGMDGLELAATPGIPPIIFTTAHVQHAASAFELDAVDFLPKPVRAERLEQALERARRRIANGPLDLLTVTGAYARRARRGDDSVRRPLPSGAFPCARQVHGALRRR